MRCFTANDFTTGTDEAAIINVLSHRSNEQRQAIKQRFKLMFGKVGGVIYPGRIFPILILFYVFSCSVVFLRPNLTGIILAW